MSETLDAPNHDQQENDGAESISSLELPEDDDMVELTDVTYDTAGAISSLELPDEAVAETAD